MSEDKYAPQAHGWTESAYGDAAGYLARRATAIVELGVPLGAGDLVLDLACGDGGLARFFPAGIAYRGVDTSAEMVAAARARGVDAVQGDLNDYEPPEPVAATTCFRAIYYSHERAAFFRRVYAYTAKKLVFDLNPRQYALEAVRGELLAAGFARVDVRPFFVPQRYALPGAAARALRLLEESGTAARLLLRHRFTYVVAASR